MLTAERSQFRNACRIVIEARKPMPGLDADIELGFRNVHSTNRLLHGNLPCPCDRNSSDCSVVRDMAKIPKLTHGCSRRGNGRHRHASWPVATGQDAKSLPSHESCPCRYKGLLPQTPTARRVPLTRNSLARISTSPRLGEAKLRRGGARWTKPTDRPIQTKVITLQQRRLSPADDSPSSPRPAPPAARREARP